MECFICGSAMSFYFSKQFHAFGLDVVDYWRCGECGFCASKTHAEMSDRRWAELNEEFHAWSHARDDNPYNRNQRYFQQATMMSLMARSGIVRRGRWLDWGSGVGSVSHLLEVLFNEKLWTFDKYFTPEHNPIEPAKLNARSFDLVLNTAVFEHVRGRETLDEIEGFVAESGCFAIHTLVPETVPQDPGWMYLLPVHCAFHTNRSMNILMSQWGYTCSCYNEHAKLWVLFKGEPTPIGERIAGLNELLGWEYLHFKPGFMDFWK